MSRCSLRPLRPLRPLRSQGEHSSQPAPNGNGKNAPGGRLQHKSTFIACRVLRLTALSSAGHQRQTRQAERCNCKLAHRHLEHVSTASSRCENNACYRLCSNLSYLANRTASCWPNCCISDANNAHRAYRAHLCTYCARLQQLDTCVAGKFIAAHQLPCGASLPADPCCRPLHIVGECSVFLRPLFRAAHLESFPIPLARLPTHNNRHVMADAQHFIQKGVELGQKAVELDHAACKSSDPEKYDQAKRTYLSAIDYFRTALKYEKVGRTKETLNNKIYEYLGRSELMNDWLKDYRTNQASGGGGGGAATAKKKAGTTKKPPAKKGDGGGNKNDGGDEDDDDDEETKQMKDSLNSIILSTKPDVKWDDVAGLE
eukprot:IDg18667t1